MTIKIFPDIAETALGGKNYAWGESPTAVIQLIYIILANLIFHNWLFHDVSVNFLKQGSAHAQTPTKHRNTQTHRNIHTHIPHHLPYPSPAHSYKFSNEFRADSFSAGIHFRFITVVLGVDVFSKAPKEILTTELLVAIFNCLERKLDLWPTSYWSLFVCLFLESFKLVTQPWSLSLFHNRLFPVSLLSFAFTSPFLFLSSLCIPTPFLSHLFCFPPLFLLLFESPVGHWNT